MIDQQQHYGKATTETEGIAINLIAKHKPEVVVIDEGAMGAGVVDHLIQESHRVMGQYNFKFEIKPFNFGSKATDDKFANRATECYFDACNAIDKGQVQLMNDDELCSQISSRRYKFNSKGAMQLESKADHKKRGLPSPDKADAAIMALSESLNSNRTTLFEVLEENKLKANNLISAGDNW